MEREKACSKTRKLVKFRVCHAFCHEFKTSLGYIARREPGEGEIGEWGGLDVPTLLLPGL